MSKKPWLVHHISLGEIVRRIYSTKGSSVILTWHWFLDINSKQRSLTTFCKGSRCSHLRVEGQRRRCCKMIKRLVWGSWYIIVFMDFHHDISSIFEYLIFVSNRFRAIAGLGTLWTRLEILEHLRVLREWQLKWPSRSTYLEMHGIDRHPSLVLVNTHWAHANPASFIKYQESQLGLKVSYLQSRS